jgi:PAS domain S-box-containing protein
MTPTRGELLSLRFPSVLQRYGLAVLSVAIALSIGLILYRYHIQGQEFPLFVLAIVVTSWYAGPRPAFLALVLSILAFDYFFTEPRFSFYVTWADIPYYLVFILFALVSTWFSLVRRRVEQELLRSREELQKEVSIRSQQASLLNLTHDPIFVRDMDGVITYWNRGAQELYGWTAEQAIGKRTHDLLRIVYPEPLDEIQKELLRAGRWEGELAKTRANGTSVSVASRWALQRDANGLPVAILETENDITERKQREEQVRGLNQQLGRRSVELESSNKELEAFAYSISHDLRAPLRHIVGFGELLQRGASANLDDKGRRHLTMILDSAKRMGALIDDLLAFSRIGRAETRHSMVSFEHLVKEVQSEVWRETEGRNFQWKIGPLPDLYGDRSMLKVALVNLISNAIKFTRTRTKAEIEIGCSDKQTDGIVVFIRDNGVGFDMKYVDKLFGVFQRLHKMDEFEGTGIGLATVQRIIHRHGGRVWAEGQVGSGATFYLSFPKP